MTSVRIWGPGAGAVVVLVAAGVWARGSSAVDAGLWAEVRPVIEARLVAQETGSGYAETGRPELRSRWFCRAEALELEESGGRVRAGVDTLCLEYGVHGDALVECTGEQTPQVMRLERRPAGGGFRVVSAQAPPDGAGYGEWEESHFGSYAASRLDRPMDSAGLRTAARTHFGLPADAPVRDC
ncbi:hypothetical protein [Streptomyces shenzhenensis]|uniref:hypothetical protein n=1 Tax=Streptomyces shenzhenensis TaxID=943815 RepID=UPI001F28C342|nr:hypothetical protein [Streptomyces shenzhenensis]